MKNSQETRKPHILIIRWSNIGDLVMALPVAATIHASEPEAKIAWFVEKRFRELLENHRHIEKVYTFDRMRYKGHRWKPWTWRGQLLGYLQLREFQPDIAIDLHGYPKTALALLLSSAKKRYVVNPKDALARRLGTVILPPRDLHVVEANVWAIKEIGFTQESYDFGIPISKTHEEWVTQTLGEGGWVTIHLGTSKPQKNWDPRKYAEIARRLQDKGLRVILVGGTDERPLTEEFLKHTRAENWVGKTSLLQTAEILRRARFHLSGDTGTAHLASALGTPCVTVFGHMPPHRFHPFRQPEAVVDSGGDITRVPVETVWQKCLERLALPEREKTLFPSPLAPGEEKE
jgi:heptosyltransferase-1